MGQIFLWAGQGSPIDSDIDTAFLARLHNQSARALKGQGFSVLEVPVGLSLPKAIAWINVRARPGAVALALETATFPSAKVRGTSVFYTANNTERCTQAEQVLRSVVQHLPSLVSRGVQPDTDTATGRLAFAREVNIPSLVLSLGFVTNLTDRLLLLERPNELAHGIFQGLLHWSRRLTERGNRLPFAPLSLYINEQRYGEQGILVEGDAYVPADVLDHCAIALPRATTPGWLHYGGITYIRAIELREAGVFVRWEAETKTARLQTLMSFQPGALGDIIGPGYLLPSDYEAFLQQVNPGGLQQFPDITQLYQAEAATEGVNPDVAFAQALLETYFFGFSSLLSPIQNNFGGLGATSGSHAFASFPSAQIGVRAHIQHLKAYANEEPLVQAVVDPRFSFVTRGVAPRVEQLSRRWSAEADYGDKILAMLRRLYGAAGLL
ncbi:glucosaminidase domain-containing protein [Phormidium sp. FACHB-592]|uniref:Glucosaminidase domain-containing protein n=1 Tax=Stenomitos frigidus AS-A4 TaxID=2933935 RepID=A0ABV0KKF0_9CYAN|nr:glucosaminidase domain-containing protein [Phormidium sp. FACHB-592]MBD2076993.1 glucosaminidase domain-containing protein [Phormidium sp. FACHB-592]